MVNKAFWLVAAVIGVELLLVVAAVGNCVANSERLIELNRECFSTDARNAIHATLAGLLAASIAIYMGKQP